MIILKSINLLLPDLSIIFTDQNLSCRVVGVLTFVFFVIVPQNYFAMFPKWNVKERKHFDFIDLFNFLANV